MSGIVIFGGTTEGRKLAEAFAGTALQVSLCVATEYGASLIPSSENLQIHTGRLEPEQMTAFLREAEPELVLDATHPYAAVVTEHIRAACLELKLPLLRVSREQKQGAETDAEDIIFVDSVEEAAAYLRGTEGRILLTTGSKELEKYAVIENYKERCVARVLPTLPVMEKCSGLGFTGKNLIAMQGPFSLEMNVQMIRAAGCRFLVTKESGKEGGYEEKCQAALETGTRLIVVRRPREAEPQPESCSDTSMRQEARGEEKRRKKEDCADSLPAVLGLHEAIVYVCERFGIQEKRSLYLIGAGPGSRELLTGEALGYLAMADCIIGAGRILDICRGIKGLEDKPMLQSYKKEEIADFLHSHTAYQRAALVYSGDIGFYSGASGVQRLLPGFETVRVSGISSAEYFLNKIGVGREELPMVSCHGQRRNLVSLLLKKGSLFTLLGKGEEINAFCETLAGFGLHETQITVGQRLSYPDERIVSGTPGQLRGQTFGDLSVLYARLPYGGAEGAVRLPEDGAGEALREKQQAVGRYLGTRGLVTPGLPDDLFLRDAQEGEKTPMTKQGVRILSLSRLELTERAVVYDVGAGTGSVSIEAARLCTDGQVYAIEKKPGAVALLEKNRLRFQVENMTVVEGEAPEILEGLPAPTHVFIGGSSGRLREIIEAVRRKNPKARFVVNAVTLETIAELQRLPEYFPEYEDRELLQVSVSAAKKLGGYHLMRGENPVMIAAFGG